MRAGSSRSIWPIRANFRPGKGCGRISARNVFRGAGAAADRAADPLADCAQAQNQAAEVPAFPCVDAIETAADKLSALAWRVFTRDRAAPNDDPTIIRHLHDLAALEHHAKPAAQFKDLVRRAVAADADRGGNAVPADARERFAGMFERLRSDELWAAEYDALVRQVSFARAGEEISFAAALVACDRIAASVYG